MWERKDLSSTVEALVNGLPFLLDECRKTETEWRATYSVKRKQASEAK
jgi:hypothetical protein